MRDLSSPCITSGVDRPGTIRGGRVAGLWGLCALIRHRRVQLALSIRVTIAAVVSLALAQFSQLPLPLWAVMTAVIVTQMSVGRSLKATFDYLVGTLGGAIYGGAVGLLVPHSNEIALLAVLAMAVAPLTLLAAGGYQGISPLVFRLDRWTGAIKVCSPDPDTMRNPNSFVGAEFACEIK